MRKMVELDEAEVALAVRVLEDAHGGVRACSTSDVDVPSLTKQMEDAMGKATKRGEALENPDERNAWLDVADLFADAIEAFKTLAKDLDNLEKVGVILAGNDDLTLRELLYKMKKIYLAPGPARACHGEVDLDSIEELARKAAEPCVCQHDLAPNCMSCLAQMDLAERHREIRALCVEARRGRGR